MGPAYCCTCMQARVHIDCMQIQQVYTRHNAPAASSIMQQLTAGLTRQYNEIVGMQGCRLQS